MIYTNWQLPGCTEWRPELLVCGTGTRGRWQQNQMILFFIPIGWWEQKQMSRNVLFLSLATPFILK